MMNRSMIKKQTIFLFLFLTAHLNFAQAALFDDKEARKKILEVESTMQTQDQAAQAAIAELKKNQQALEAVVKGQGLADMLNQMESMQQEIARLKGDLELATHTIEALQQRQKDLYTDADNRIRKLEATPVATSVEKNAEMQKTDASVSEENLASTGQIDASKSAAESAKNTQEIQALQAANQLSKSLKHKEAFAAYDKFLKDYPNSAFADEAKYGLGYSQYSLKNFKSALATQQKLVDAHPESPKVPDALMSIGNSQVQLGQIPAAKKSYRALIEKFPQSELVPTAQKRLKLLESIK